MIRRIYGLLLRLYPDRFRSRFGAEMTEAFTSLHGRVAREGAAAVLLLWLRTAADAVRSGLGERLRDRTPPRAAFHLHHAWRGLRRAPGYSAAFILTLGLAIGVNSAVFSVVDAVLLDPLPFEDADRILYVKQPAPRHDMENATFSFMEIDDYREVATTVDEFVEFGDWDFTVVGEGEPHRAVAGMVTSNYFEVLGMEPILGRTLEADDDGPGAEPVAVLTHDYWTRVFGGDPEIVGRLVSLTGIRSRIVGVLEPGVHYTASRQPELYANYATNEHYQGAAMRDSRTHRMTDLFVRAAPGVQPEAVRAELKAVAARLRAEHPQAYPPAMGFELEVVPWQEELTRNARPILLLLMATVGAVLLLAGANVANLTLTRLVRKGRELSTRGALGATATDLRLHLTAENVLLSGAGALLGLGLAVLSRDALVAYASRFTVRAQEVAVDGTVLVATLLAGVTVAVVLAWLPGLPVAPGTERVASAASRSTHGRSGKRVQRALVVGQLALSFTLLAGAALLARSLMNLSAVDPGFHTENVLAIESPAGNFGSADGDEELFRQVLEEVRAFPGVRHAAVATRVPLEGGYPMAWNVRVEGGSEGEDRSWPTGFNYVSPDYFELLGMRLVAGRLLEPGDRPDTESVAVVNRSFARSHFGDEPPVGRRISFSMGGGNWSDPARIVGVVEDTREWGLDRPPVDMAYGSAVQFERWGPALVVSTAGDVDALARHVREAVHAVDPDRPVEHVVTLAELRDRNVAPSRLNATLFGAFGLLALLIASVGVLGVLAFSVSQRVREYGVRLALGASRGGVLQSVLAEAVVLVVLALAMGLVGAWVVGGLLSDLLYGVEPADPASLAGAALLLGAVGLSAALLPAVRAMRVDPARVLQAE